MKKVFWKAIIQNEIGLITEDWLLITLAQEDQLTL